MSSNIKLDFPASDIQMASELESPSGGCAGRMGLAARVGRDSASQPQEEKRREGGRGCTAVTARKPGTGQSLKKIDQGKGPPLKF